MNYLYKVGMCGGCFAPFHLGHKHLIITAASQCEELYVVLSVSKYDKIPYEYRYRWLYQATKDMSNVKLITIFDESEDKSVYDWETGCEDVKKKISKPIDAVFVGDDYNYSGNPYEIYYNTSNIIYVDRSMIPISSSEINKNIYKYWDYICPEARSYYVKKVLVIGTECCGKSTLVKNLSHYYNTNNVEENGREVCEESGGLSTMVSSDYINILFKHKADEIEKIKTSNKLLFIDTDCITTNFYYNLSFGENKDFNNLVSSINNFNSYDLILYVDLTLSNGYEYDITRLDATDKEREENNLILKSMFDSHNLNYKIVRGTFTDIYTQSIDLINELLYSKPVIGRRLGDKK